MFGHQTVAIRILEALETSAVTPSLQDHSGQCLLYVRASAYLQLDLT